jgi:putative ABC transport system ATP-binding protein
VTHVELVEPLAELGPTGPQPVLALEDVVKVYGEGETAVHALRGVSLLVQPGEFLAVMGASGSGKSTLMNLVGCLDVPTAGTYHLDGIDVATLDDRQLAIVRNRKIGFVFQSFNLVPRMSTQANVELPLVYAGVRAPERRRRAEAALSLVGMSGRAHHKPHELSGGQQQRAAVARALVTAPSLILADEPTGNLDTESSDEVLAVFDQLSALGRTIVMITHEDDVAHRAQRIVHMKDGRITTDSPSPRTSTAVTA